MKFSVLRFRKRAALTVGAMTALAVIGLNPLPAHATTTYQELSASDAGKYNRFGTSVAISADGNTMLVGGQFRDDSSGNPVGPPGAYVFKKSAGSWTQTAELFSSDGANGDLFGYSVAISSDGTEAVIGAPDATISSTSDAGAAYVFNYSGSSWSQTTKLSTSTVNANESFGQSVSLSGDGTKLLVGAPLYGSATIKTGAAYFYGLSGGTWSLNTTLIGVTSHTNSLFGTTVTMSNDGLTAAVGMPDYSYLTGSTTTYDPAVFTYKASGSSWLSGSQLYNPGGTNLSGFGNAGLSLSADGTLLGVGAPNVSVIGSTSVGGAAYIYTKSGSTWTSPAALYKALSGTGARNFGKSLSLSPDDATVIIGQSSGNATGAAGGGAAFIWTKSGSTWSITNTLTATDTVSGDSFGWSTSIAAGNSTPVVGAVNHASGGLASSGAVYAYTIS